MKNKPDFDLLLFSGHGAGTLIEAKSVIVSSHVLRDMEREVVLGFTGSRDGMTKKQISEFTQMVHDLEPIEFHHGDCIGADQQAHDIVRQLFPDCKIVVHPPPDFSYRAFRNAHEWRPCRPYFDRDADMVAEVTEIIAAPRGLAHERGNSATWAVISLAEAETDKVLHILKPNDNS